MQTPPTSPLPDIVRTRQAGGSPASERPGRSSPLPRRSPSRAAAEHLLEEEVLRAIALHLRDQGGDSH